MLLLGASTSVADRTNRTHGCLDIQMRGVKFRIMKDASDPPPNPTPNPEDRDGISPADLEQDDDEELEHQTATSAAQSGESEADEPEDLSSSDESESWFSDAPPDAEPPPKRATPATRSTGSVPSMTPSPAPFPLPTAAAQRGTRRATDTVRNQKIKSLVARQCMLLRIHNDDPRSNADIAFDYLQLVELRWENVRRKGLEWDRPLSRYDMGKISIEDLYDWFMDERPQDPPSLQNKQKLHSIFHVRQRELVGNKLAIRDILQQPCCWQTWNEIRARQTIMCKKKKKKKKKSKV